MQYVSSVGLEVGWWGDVHHGGQEGDSGVLRVPIVLDNDGENGDRLYEMCDPTCSIEPLFAIREKERDHEITEAENGRDDIDNGD